MAAGQRRTVAAIISNAFSLLFRHPMVFLLAALPQLVLSLGHRPVSPLDFDDSMSISLLAEQFQQRWRELWHDPNTTTNAIHWNADPGGALGWQYPSPEAALGGGEVVTFASLVGLTVLLGATALLCVSVFRSAAICVATGELLAGRRPTISLIFRSALERIPSLALATILIALFMLPGVILAFGFAAAGSYLGAPVLTRILGMIVAIIWVITVYVRFALTVPAVVVGGYRGVAALRRSEELWQYSWGRILGVLSAAVLALTVLRVGVISLAKGVGLIVQSPYYFGLPVWLGVAEQMALIWCNQLMPIIVVVLYAEVSGDLAPAAIAASGQADALAADTPLT